MATSGTTSFALQVDEIIEEALLRIGGEPQVGKEVQSARRSPGVPRERSGHTGSLNHSFASAGTCCASRKCCKSASIWRGGLRRN